MEKKKDFSFVFKEMLKLIIRNTDFWTGYVLTMISFFFFLTFWVQYFLINSTKDRKLDWKREEAENFLRSVYTLSNIIGT